MSYKGSQGSTVGIVITVFGLAAVVPALLGMREAWAVFAAIFGGVFALLGLIAFFAAGAKEDFMEKHFTGDRLIADWPGEDGEEGLKVFAKGIVIDGMGYLNESMESTLEAAGIHPLDAKKFVFLYRTMQRRNFNKRTPIIVDIPEGGQADAESIALVYNKPLPQDYIDSLRDAAADAAAEQEAGDDDE